MPTDTTPALPVVSYTARRHEVSCAVFDPTPGHCDCNLIPERPLTYHSTAVAKLTAALARAAELERKRDALRAAGALMANTMFNLAQRPGEVWGADLCRSFDKMRRDWDAAVAAVPPNSDLGHQAERLTPGVRSEPGGSS